MALLICAALILIGLGICYLSPSGGKLAPVLWWVGILIAALGLLVIVARIAVYVEAQLQAMLGA